MSSDVRIYKIRDFIRKNEKGDIDFERSQQIIHELAVAASFHAGHNILVDMRETSVVGDAHIGDILQLSLEMARYGSVFKGKIANVIPGDPKRLSIARQFKNSLNLLGLRYEVFTSFEDAIDWLSDITDLSPLKTDG